MAEILVHIAAGSISSSLDVCSARERKQLTYCRQTSARAQNTHFFYECDELKFPITSNTTHVHSNLHLCIASCDKSKQGNDTMQNFFKFEPNELGLSMTQDYVNLTSFYCQINTIWDDVKITQISFIFQPTRTIFLFH